MDGSLPASPVHVFRHTASSAVPPPIAIDRWPPPLPPRLLRHRRRLRGRRQWERRCPPLQPHCQRPCRRRCRLLPHLGRGGSVSCEEGRLCERGSERARCSLQPPSQPLAAFLIHCGRRLLRLAICRPSPPPFLGDFGRRGCRESDSQRDRESEQFWSSILPCGRRRRTRPRARGATTLATAAAVKATVSRSQCPLPKHRKKKHFTRRRRYAAAALNLPSSTAATVLSPLLLPPYSAPRSLTRAAAAAADSLSHRRRCLTRWRPHHFTFVPSFVRSVGRPTRVQSLTPSAAAAAAAAACPFVCSK